VRTFPKGDKEPKVIWQGIDDKRNPLELPAEDKSILAHFTKELGLKKAADCIKIPMFTLRAWVGAYCRGEKTESQETQKPKRPYHYRNKVDLKLDQPIKLDDEGKLAEPVELPPFPPFDNSWEAQVQSEWLVTYLQLVKLK